MTDEDFFASLEAEIAPVLEKAKLEADRKKFANTAKSKHVSEWDKVLARRQIQEIDQTLQALIWTPMATVAFFAEQSCDGCGSVHSLFLQYMQKESTGRHNPTTRWARISRPDLSLPKEVIIQQTTTHICKDCCEDHGFELPSADRKFLSSEAPFTISPNYLQEDLNAEA